MLLMAYLWVFYHQQLCDYIFLHILILIFFRIMWPKQRSFLVTDVPVVPAYYLVYIAYLHLEG